MSRPRMLLLAGALALVLVGGMVAQGNRAELGSPGTRDGGVEVLTSAATPAARLAGNPRPLFDTAGLVGVLAALALLAAHRGWTVPLVSADHGGLRPARSVSRGARAPPALGA